MLRSGRSCLPKLKQMVVDAVTDDKSALLGRARSSLRLRRGPAIEPRVVARVEVVDAVLDIISNILEFSGRLTTATAHLQGRNISASSNFRVRGRTPARSAKRLQETSPVCLENSCGSDFPHIAQAIKTTQPIIVNDKKKLRRSINAKFAHFRLYAIAHGMTVISTPTVQSHIAIETLLKPNLAAVVSFSLSSAATGRVNDAHLGWGSVARPNSVGQQPTTLLAKSPDTSEEIIRGCLGMRRKL
jgi:hypothetical protein